VTTTLAREDLWRLYETHVAEYRFQVQLNNQRYQWYTALDVALITIGTGLLRLSGKGDGEWLTSLVFAVGIALALFTMVATARQVGYQHAARAQAIKVAEELGAADLAVASTPGWRGGPNRWWTKVRTTNYALLVILAAVNLAGFIYVVA
jgi:hypothetical protein